MIANSSHWARARMLAGVIGVLWCCSCSAKDDSNHGGAAIAAGPQAGSGGTPGGAGAVPGGNAGAVARTDASVSNAGGGPAAGSGGSNSGGSGGGTAAPDASSAVDGSAALDAGTSTSGNDASTDPDGLVPIAKPNEIHGVNWADQRDNFVNGLLQLSGLDSRTDTYDSVQTKTSQIVGQFRDELGANTIRIPINEPTVSSAWWDSYKAVIDTTTALDMNVIVAYWAYHNQKPDDEAAFKAMWKKVVAEYADNNRVFFDIHNEPSGLGSSWNDLAARWLDAFPDLPRARVIVAGRGSDDQVVPVGSDSRFDGCVLEFHYYTFWHEDWNRQKQWRDAVSAAIGPNTSRTIVGEWGALMTSGLDYNTTMPDGNNSVSYITAMADFIRENKMGSVYWPGLRDQDTYSLMKRGSSGGAIDLTITNASGRDRLRWSWGL